MSQACYGVLKEGLVLIPTRGARKLLGVLYTATQTGARIIGCPQLRLFETLQIIPVSQIVEKASVYHDCMGGHCMIRATREIERIEQENVTKEKLVVKHSPNYKIYLLNDYKI